jgi:hypothetical protein
MVVACMTAEQIVDDFPQLSAEEVHEALLYAAAAVAERELPLRPTSWPQPCSRISIRSRSR